MTPEEKFKESLEKHIKYVHEAGTLIGVPEEQLAIHDDSKWTEVEFTGYAHYFHGERTPEVIDRFACAWLNHIHQNPHHWNHWIFADGYTPKDSSVENGVVRMPDNYALEMIADWMGASMAYTGSFDMTSWLIENMPKIRLHSKTAGYVWGILNGMGYDVHNRQFDNQKTDEL